MRARRTTILTSLSLLLLVEVAAAQQFLRKDIDDTAFGVVTFAAATTDVQGTLVDTTDGRVDADKLKVRSLFMGSVPPLGFDDNVVWLTNGGEEWFTLFVPDTAWGNYPMMVVQSNDADGVAQLTGPGGQVTIGRDYGYGLEVSGNITGLRTYGQSGKGIHSSGATRGGEFQDNDHSGVAYAATGDAGVMGWGDFYGAYFKDNTSQVYTYVALSSSGVQSNGTKNFVQNHPERSTHVVVFASLEGDEVGTYTRGSARLHEGAAHVALSPAFRLVTNPDLGVTVQLTPRGDCRGLYVEAVSTTELVVRELSGGTSSVPFDFVVNGLRIGFEEESVVRPKLTDAPIPLLDANERYYEREPALRELSAGARFERMRAELGEPASLDSRAADALKAAVGLANSHSSAVVADVEDATNH